MPILNVKVSGQRSKEMTKSISKILLELTSRILHKDPEVTAIAIEYVHPEDWIVAGKSLAEHGKSSIYFDIKVGHVGVRGIHMIDQTCRRGEGNLGSPLHRQHIRTLSYTLYYFSIANNVNTEISKI